MVYTKVARRIKPLEASMDEKRLLAKALELGFANAALVNTEDLVFIPSFRPLCEENLCGKYGVNYS